MIRELCEDILMDEQTFIDGSREIWERLAFSLEATGREGARMGAGEVRQLHEDYRRTAADLAYAQTHYPGSKTEAHLNTLVGQAHARLYGSAPRNLKGVWEFLARGYPRLVRARWRAVAASAVLLFGAVALGFLLAHVNYPLARLFVPEALRESVGERVEQGIGFGDVASLGPLLTAGITANNIQVALTAFAGGMTFGALTVYALIMNGLLLGSLAGMFSLTGESVYFWTLIVPHGSLELPAIVLAAAGGLVLAGALISPGDLPRGAALRAASGDAAKLVLGSIPLFLIAGVIEGFFTPSAADGVLKLAFGALASAILAAYLFGAGRGGEPAAGRTGESAADRESTAGRGP